MCICNRHRVHVPVTYIRVLDCLGSGGGKKRSGGGDGMGEREGERSFPFSFFSFFSVSSELSYLHTKNGHSDKHNHPHINSDHSGYDESEVVQYAIQTMAYCTHVHSLILSV